MVQPYFFLVNCQSLWVISTDYNFLGSCQRWEWWAVLLTFGRLDNLKTSVLSELIYKFQLIFKLVIYFYLLWYQCLSGRTNRQNRSKHVAKGFALQDVQRYYKIRINIKAWYWSKRGQIISLNRIETWKQKYTIKVLKSIDSNRRWEKRNCLISPIKQIL